MANLDPEADVLARLAGTRNYLSTTGGTFVLTSGANLFRGPMRDDLGDAAIATQCVFVETSGGIAPQPYLDGADKSLFRASVTVSVRSLLEEYSAGQAIARACLRRLHLTTLASAYTSCKATVSEPMYDSWQENGCHVWRIPLEVTWKETAAV